MPVVSAISVLKKHCVFFLKATLLTRYRTFDLTCGFEWVLGTCVRHQFILVSFVIAVGHGLYGGHGFLDGGWWLGVDSLLWARLVHLFMQVPGQWLMLLGLLLCGLGGR